MNQEKENKLNCDHNEECSCGCHEGKDCSCHNNDHIKNCGCLDGEECTCGDNCDCGESCSCGCKDGKECTCGDDCNCKHEHNDSCDCKHEHNDSCDCKHEHNDSCDCGHEHLSKDQIIQEYEKAFVQFEQALIKVDKELSETKKKAEDNERLAITFKKDLERYKERVKEEQDIMKVNAIENVADKLIPILDNFEQALKISGDPNIIKGFEMIEGMLKNAVKSLGIEEIDSAGEDFDPNLHNAVSKVKTKDKKKNNKIASVYQKGYKMVGENGKVIRHSMVEIYLQD